MTTLMTTLVIALTLTLAQWEAVIAVIEEDSPRLRDALCAISPSLGISEERPHPTLDLGLTLTFLEEMAGCLFDMGMALKYSRHGSLHVGAKTLFRGIQPTPTPALTLSLILSLTPTLTPT